MKKKERKSAYQRQSWKEKSQISGMNVYFLSFPERKKSNK